MEELDDNKDKIGMWVTDVGGSQAKYKACLGKSFCCKKGKDAFIQHSKAKKHIENIKRWNSKTKQLSIKDALEGDALEQAVKKKARRFEIDFTMRLDSHNASSLFV